MVTAVGDFNNYLDFGVVRIQSWLTRTPKLRGRRGASTMLSNATRAKDIAEALTDRQVADLAEVNKEAGDIDGVVSLRMRRADHASLEKVERAVAGHLRAHLPATSLKVTHWSGQSYMDARSSGQAEFEHEWPASVAEWPPGHPCQWCQVWPATEVLDDWDDNDAPIQCAVCEDCLRRGRNAGHNTSSKKKPGPEEQLIRHARCHRTAPLDLPDHFASLAMMDGHRQTHVATVHADGNAIGTFIDEARHKTPHLNSGLPSLIDGATWDALLYAISEIQDARGDRCLPVIPHLVGGDDVLVSVPAQRAWRFVKRFQEMFTEQLRAAAPQLDADAVPTASVGLVFHHRTTPFFVFTELSEKLLKHAKAEHRGQKPALAWQEITQDGAEPTARPSLLHQDLEGCWNDLHRLAALPQSTRQRLSTVLASDGDLDDHVARLDLTNTVSPFRDGGPIALSNALKMVRWWQP